MKVIIKTIRNYSFLLIGLIIAYVIALTLVFTLPNSAVEPEFNDSMQVFEHEGEYPRVFYDKKASQLDNFTDKLMVGRTIKDESLSPFEAAMSMNNYPRYWHGYQVILRPLISGLNYSNIRYVNMFFILSLFCLTFLVLHKSFGIKASVPFIITMAMIYITILPMSLQYTSVFAITMIAIILMGYFNSQIKSFYLYYGYSFLIIGSITNFFDLLTAPIVTLGIPLVFAFLLENKRDKGKEFIDSLLFIIKNSFLWGLGYGATWAFKWIIATLFTENNVIQDALNQSVVRTVGTESQPVDRIRMFTENFNLMFPSVALKMFVVLVVVWLIVLIIKHKPFHEILNLSPLLLIATYPYIWQFFLSNHSQHHSWFVYRIQSVTVFAVLVFMMMCLNLKNKHIETN